MFLTALVILVNFITHTSSQTTVVTCTNKTGCDTPMTLRFLGSPTGSSTYSPPMPISVSCSVIGSNLANILWLRNSTDGNYTALNATSITEIAPNFSTGKLVDSPPEDKLPYTYQCLAIGKCCEKILSRPITVRAQVSDEGNSIKLQHIRIEPARYTGYGKVKIKCIGGGDDKTTVDWIKTDKDGNIENLNTTILDLNHAQTDGIWQAFLYDRPNVAKFPYEYQCVVKNRCCSTLTSKRVEAKYMKTSGCPVFGVIKQIKINTIVQKRSVKIIWTYDADPEDTGIVFTINDRVKAFNITTREFIVDGLVPNTWYGYNYRILYGIACNHSVPAVSQFKTLEDIPSKPRNVTVFAKDNTLNVSWLHPKFPNGEGLYYAVFWKRIDTNDKFEQKNVTSNHNYYIIKNLAYSTSYSIQMLAANDVGNGATSSLINIKTKEEITANPTDSGSDVIVAVAIIGAILFVVLLLILFLFARKRISRKQRRRSAEDIPIDRQVHAGIPVPPQPPGSQHSGKQLWTGKSDFSEEVSYIVLLEDWEIASNKLKLLDEELGGGQFGIVKKGLLTTGKDSAPAVVAVKTVKDSRSESHLSDLKSELMILKDVNKVSHPNVIKLIGGCSIAGKLHVITEFCPGGSLIDLLRSSRVYPSPENSSNYINLASTLNHRQLLKIAVDVSCGMVHLASEKFVHRDLAARNILIGEDNMAKISDFGLARDIAGAEEYIRNNQNLLPVKWMALESLLYGRFTTASDVWSYGILLHEITTLGDEPYEGISSHNIVSHVGSGCRMSQSPQCSDEIYQLMTKCWQIEPADRPTFEEIRERLHDMLMDKEKSYINVTQIIDEGSLALSTHNWNTQL